MQKTLNIILGYKYIFLVILLTIPGIIPLLHPGLPPTHDGEYHVIRFHQFYKTLSSGILYPRWAMDLNNGLGIPLFNYVYPLPNYVSAFLYFLGFSFIDTFKLNLFFGTLIGSVFMYILSKHYWGELGGVVSAISYAYVPYRFVDIYIRGSVGEIWAIAFFPAFIWSITKLVEKNTPKFIISSSIFLALIIFSHNILAVMFTLFASSYCLFLLSRIGWKKQIVKSMILSILLGICLPAVFWLPALVENKLVRGLQIYSINDNFPEFYQLIIPSWGSGFSGSNLLNQMSFQIGLVPIVIIILSILILFKHKLNSPKTSHVLLFFLAWFFISVIFMLRLSYPLWINIPLLSYFQFPWRFLSLTMVVTSFISGGIVYSIFSPKLQFASAVVIITLTILATISYTKPAYYHYRDDRYYLTKPNFINGTNSPGDLFNTIWIKDTDLHSKGIKYMTGFGKISNTVNNPNYKEYMIDSGINSEVEVGLAYFPGWIVRQDGKTIALKKMENGLIGFGISEGKHNIELIFLDTITRRVASAITLMSGLVILSISIISRKLKLL